jgi:hypothetical protein
MTSIPANKFVSVLPGVLGAGGNPLSANAIFLSQSIRFPIGAVVPFATAEDVDAYCGASSDEAKAAHVYFEGFAGKSIVPGALYFAQFNAAAVAAYLRSASLADMTLAELQAFSGTLTLTINGTPYTTGSIDLSGATSFSNAAAIMQTALNTALASTTCAYDSQLSAFVIKSPTTGDASTISFATAGALATGVRLTAATGAVLSQGSDVAVPAVFMASLVDVTQNWVSFMTIWEPLLADKLLFADWVTTTQDRYAYACWDTDVTVETSNAVGTFGQLTKDFDGVVAIYGAMELAAFFCGATASINFEETNGRITYAYKGQPGLTPSVTNGTIYDNVVGNHYNCYAAVATANDAFTYFQPGSISGEWKWADEYVNQIYLNSQLQLALVELLTSVKSIPYNQSGYNLIRAAILDVITSSLNFGSIRAGVTLSASQAAQVNTAAGAKISGVLQTSGWYLSVKDASPQVRAQRGSPPITLWYMSGQSIQKIEMASIDVL